MFTKKSHNCVLGSMGNYFSQLNPEFDPSFCFFVLEKMELQYIKDGPSLKENRLTHNIAESYFDLAKKFDLKSTFLISKNHNLKKMIIEKGVPFIFEVYSKNLNHHPAYEMNKWDLTHFLTVLKLEGNEVLLSDCDIPTMDGIEIYEGKADLKNLQKAWKQGNYWYYDRTDVEDFVRSFSIDKNVCKQLFDKNMQLFLSKSVEVQRTFANELLTFIDLYGEQEIKQGISKLGLQIQMLGLIASRHYLKEFLIDHLHYTNNEILDFIEKDINEWHVICLLFYKIELICKPSLFENVNKRILDLTEQEQKVFTKLRDEIKLI